MNAVLPSQQTGLVAREARRVPGFTAIELLVVVVIVAVLATLALPSFNTVVSRYRVRTAVEDLTATIYLARSEAIRRGGGVVLRKVTVPGCTAPEPRDWNCGWLVFVDRNGNGTFDKDDELLQSTPAPRGVDVRQTADESFMRLNRWGDLGWFGTTIGPVGSDDVARKTVLCMSGGGRLRVLPGVECPR